MRSARTTSAIRTKCGACWKLRNRVSRTLFLTASVIGARQGELLALRRSDLELPREGSGKMAIRRSLSVNNPATV